ncbi:MAG: BREX-1 system adenine-specific DNA-methyltransferase PglX [Clostridium butyricum]|uniref:BREX-1 system adenine-specific DNA-methyltransferase PglX n=1 Tax=Clostridium sp. TaxID=1506 RepID=UPI0028FE2079|nr:BREX-1 system adenine-specific DNA-methyltransferase PglX [Clostridium sp.]MDU1116774.1 BREX-1 system adenine-specific DNA-methyltransferase PglX [Clostridium sp.]MDU7712741.1 BREX-1 system adenine-specific DNA-methyltransferase PglX [Clostridium butyricum]
MSDTLNKTLLKKFAVDARNELRDKIALKASLYGITKEISDKDRDSKGEETFIKNEDVIIEFNNMKRTLSTSESNQRSALIGKIQRINKEGRDGFNEVIEEVSYTWFNRFVALRYMEVNGYLQSRVNVIGSKDGSNTPEIITEAMNIKLPIDKNLVYELKKDNKNEELYCYLVELQCSELNKSLPCMFEKIGHYAELLFPAGIMTSSFFRTLADIGSITEEAWKNVEIIGWLYQYYISEEKDRVIKAKKKYKKNEIPFATQLFTPDWIVRYMVQNSLGRYWIESHKEDEDLKEDWEFYLENKEKEPDFDEKIAPYINKELEVEDIKCFDPACGSGHILVYMFDVLYEIYSRCGYSKSEIPMNIIEKNIYGLDIDKRAYQLACFAVVMKGMSYDNLLLRKIERKVDTDGKYIDLNIACIQETNILYEDENTTIHDNIAFLAGEESGETYDKVKTFVESLKNANTYGSLTKVEAFDKEFLEKRLEQIKNDPGTDLFGSKSREKWELILEDLIKQASIMEKTYDILVTNPPYMGSNYMNSILSDFIKMNFEKVKGDMFSSFMLYCFSKVKKSGQLGFLTPFVWLYIRTYEELREEIINNNDISTLIQLEYNAFPEACVPVAAFTIRNINLELNGIYINLEKFVGADIQSNKVLAAISEEVDYKYYKRMSTFRNMPETEIIFSVDKYISKELADNKKLIDFAECKSGIMTGKESLFVKKWYEVNYNNIKFDCKSINEMGEYKWFPISTGGDFRKYYGNNEYVVNLYKNGQDIKSTSKNYRLRDSYYYFKEAITWSRISSSKVGFRKVDIGTVFGDAGPCIFVNASDYYWLLGFLNSNVANKFLKALNPTLNFQISDIKNIPIKRLSSSEKEIVENLVKGNLELYKYEWNSYETSKDFYDDYIINNKFNSVEEFMNDIDTIIDNLCDKIKKNEEKINKIFIKLYGLEESMSFIVEEITIKKLNIEKKVKLLISYFIGTIFKRFTINKNFESELYDTILPLNGVDNSVYGKFTEFIINIFGEESINENLIFIAKNLTNKEHESPSDTITNYIFNNFYTDHCNFYDKRPIYFEFSSGRNRAFKCLVYYHRIDKNLLSKMRTDYVQPLQNKLELEQKDLNDTLNSDATTKDKRDAKKKLGIVEKQIDELKVFHEKLRHMADKPFDIDLDDGVIHNHGLFGDLVTKIK